jgi:DNA-binding NtrC family response regulator
VRELENLLRSGLSLMNGTVLDLRPGAPVSVPSFDVDDAAEADEADDSLEPDDGPDSGDAAAAGEIEGDLDTRRQAQIVALLKQHEGNVLAVARAMKRSRGAIHRWIKKYGIETERYRK